MNPLALTFAAAMLSAVFAANAASRTTGMDAGAVYEWTDDGGRLHASDTVSEKYTSVARRIDPNRFRVPVGEQADAERQAATMKAQAASAAPPFQPSASIEGRRGSPQAASLSGSPSPNDSPKCVAWRRQVAASRECFVYSSGRQGRATYHSCCNEPDTAPEPDCVAHASR